MTIVTITIDTVRLLPLKLGALLVGSVGAYASTCLSIREALRDGKKLEIVVHQRQAAVWLSTLAGAYGDKDVRVERYTARDALRDRWGVEIPSSVTEQEILQAKLLDETVAAREGQAFVDVALEHFYGEVFTFKTFTAAQLSVLLNDFEPERWKAASRRPVIDRLLEEKLCRWEQATRSEPTLAIIGQLRSDPAALRHELCQYKILRDYPASLGEKLLGPVWELFRKAKVETEELRVARADVSNVSQEIEYYLTEMAGSLKSEEDIHLLVDQMSGHLNGEFYFLDRTLREHPEWASAPLLRRIERRFRPIQARLGSRIAALRTFVRPTLPQEPESGWTAEQWLEWAAHSYMPYCSWLEIRGEQDDLVAGYAHQFADWYYDHFNALKNAEPALFAFSGLWLDRERIAGPEAISLVLLTFVLTATS